MIELINKEDKAILVVQVEEINAKSKRIENLNRPQIIHMYAYDMHLLFTKHNIETIIYYVKRFRIDFLCINIPITKYISVARELINRLRLDNQHVDVICSGDAITPEIAMDIGSDAYTLHGDDLVRVMESLENIREQRELA